MKTSQLLPLFLILIFAYSCTEVKKEESIPVILLPENELKEQLNTFEDSSKAAWASMIEEDDQKIAYVKRLLEEISYMPTYDAITQTKLMEKCKNLKSKRFDENSILEGTNINRYDESTDSLLKSVNQLVMTTPNVERYPLVNELVQEITFMDNNVVLKRIAYDKWALMYNQLIEEQKQSLQKLGPEFTQKTKKGLFQIVEG